MQVLVVEDEVRLSEALCQIMREQKYLVDAVYTGPDGLDYALGGQYDVMVLDVMLPGLSGYEIVKQLRRKKCTLPVLMLTARDSTPDKVTGLDCGADDYMTKPFAPEELLARVRALSRRQGEVVLEQLSFEDLVLNLASADLLCKDRSVHLGFKEFEILKILMASPHSLTQKEDLITRVWGTESDAEDNNVEVYISFLRKKLTFLGSSVSLITQRKMGYRLEAAS